jgi:hypothetical protein
LLIGHAITSILAPSVAHRLADLLAVVPLDRVSTYLFWLTQKPINPSTSRTAPATIIQSRYSIAEKHAQLGRASFLKPANPPSAWQPVLLSSFSKRLPLLTELKHTHDKFHNGQMGVTRDASNDMRPFPASFLLCEQGRSGHAAYARRAASYYQPGGT